MTLAQQARSMIALNGPHCRIVEFGSEEGQVNESCLKLLKNQFLKPFTGKIVTDACLGGIMQH